MKNKTHGVILLILVIIALCTAAFIFRNSLTGSEASNIQSNAVAEAVRPAVDPDGSIPRATFFALVRKAAHVLEFALMGGVLMGLALFIANLHGRRVSGFIGSPLFVLLLTAVIDEYLQSFMDRTSSLTDVLLDFGGGAAGLFVVWGLYALVAFIVRRARA